MEEPKKKNPRQEIFSLNDEYREELRRICEYYGETKSAMLRVWIDREYQFIMGVPPIEEPTK